MIRSSTPERGRESEDGSHSPSGTTGALKNALDELDEVLVDPGELLVGAAVVVGAAVALVLGGAVVGAAVVVGMLDG